MAPRYLKIILTTCICTVVHHSICSQVIVDTGLIFDEVSSIISAMPGNTGDDYSSPTSQQLDSWGSTLDLLLNENYDRAADTAAVLNYDLIAFTDTSDGNFKTYYMLSSNATNYWGTYIYYPQYCRPLVLQAPHPKKDFNTGKEAIHVFHEADAMFYMLSGTSRCNSSSFSSCDGSTSVCSGTSTSENYRVSDMAHILNTPFQSTTDTLFSRISDSYFLQLHGFSKQSSDPFIILSNGTQITPSPDYIDSLQTHLEAEDVLFVDSIKVAHLDLSWTRLRGFSNTQGRLINNSPDPCNTNATTSLGRFIHMEQEKTQLRDNITGWTKVSNAVIATFPCNSVMSVSDPYDYGTITSRSISELQETFSLFPNPGTDQVTIRIMDKGERQNPVPIHVYSSDGRELMDGFDITPIASDKVLGTPYYEYILHFERINSGMYFIQVGNSVQKLVLY